jgi:hypothetical protein
LGKKKRRVKDGDVSVGEERLRVVGEYKCY